MFENTRAAHLFPELKIFKESYWMEFWSENDPRNDLTIISNRRKFMRDYSLVKFAKFLIQPQCTYETSIDHIEVYIDSDKRYVFIYSNDVHAKPYKNEFDKIYPLYRKGCDTYCRTFDTKDDVIDFIVGYSENPNCVSYFLTDYQNCKLSRNWRNRVKKRGEFNLIDY
jgi:hypothetical protein